jgi:enamine deaminase RidA (YjgF/YER057c/UK114 family)
MTPVTHLRPEGLVENPAFSHVASIDPAARLVLVGGQSGVDAEGRVVGDNIASQAARAFDNLQTALSAAGATLDDVVQWRIAVVGDADIQPGFAEFQERWDPQVPAPLISVARVHGLAVPGALVEIEALAAIGTTPGAAV